MSTLKEAKDRIDLLIAKARVDLYKPIQIAETLRMARHDATIDLANLETYRLPSISWRDLVTISLLGKKSSSSARYQHDVWNETAMPPSLLTLLDIENKVTNGAVERYIYLQFMERQATVTEIIAAVELANPNTFLLEDLLTLFVRTAGIRRSIDKVYEIITYALFETIVQGMGATVTISVPPESKELLAEFADLAKVLLGIEPEKMDWTAPAHVYRAGVTNAADRGLDMWANFGPAVQIKHLSLDEKLATMIIDQVESDRIIIVCKDADAKTLQIVLSQIGWGKRVQGVVKESNLIEWYDRCLRGRFKDTLASPLLERLREGFKAEFPATAKGVEFCEQRGYFKMAVPALWRTGSDYTLKDLETSG